MGVNYDRWTLLKLFEALLALSCLICKRVTDDEASRLFLYLQKVSREWRLLNNVTWDRIGSSVADVAYGGYVIITIALFLGRLFGDLPTRKRLTELILLGVGAIIFIILGSLEFASLDSLPHDLIDNAAVIGSLTLATAALFLLDMGGPKAKDKSKDQPSKNLELRSAPTHPPRSQERERERDLERTVVDGIESAPSAPNGKRQSGQSRMEHLAHPGNGYRKMRDEEDKQLNAYRKMREEEKQQHRQEIKERFGIYGRDGRRRQREYDTDSETVELGEEHSPVWGNVRKGQRHQPVQYRVDSSSATSPKLTYPVLNQQF